MKSGKRVWGVIIVSLLLIVSISLVSAAWKDIFNFGKDEGDLEGELPSQFDTTVGLQNAFPSIVGLPLVTDVDASNVPIASSVAGDVQPIANGVVYAVVKFVVQDPDGQADLPAAPTVLNVFGTPTAANGEIGVRLISPQLGRRCTLTPCRNRDTISGTYPTGITATCTGVNCGAANPDCNPGDEEYGSGDETKQKSYTCYVQMQYYDDPTITPIVAAGDLWPINLYIEDIQGNSDTANSEDVLFAGATGGWVAGDENFYIDYKTVTSFEADTAPLEYLVWTGVNTASADVVASDNDAGDADTGLTFVNLGNVPSVSVGLKPQDLLGTITPTATIEAESMSIGTIVGGANLGACDVNGGGGTSRWDGIKLDPDTPLAAYAFVVPYTAQGESIDFDELYFCIWSPLNSLTNCDAGPCLGGSGSDNSFAASTACGAICDADGEKWELTFNT